MELLLFVVGEWKPQSVVEEPGRNRSCPDAYVIGTKNRWNDMAHHEWGGYAEERYGFDVRVKEVTVRRH